jgi:hypothetical protein
METRVKLREALKSRPPGIWLKVGASHEAWSMGEGFAAFSMWFSRNQKKQVRLGK